MPTVERRYDSRATWDRASRAWQIITDWTIAGVDASDSVTGLSVRYAGIPDTVIGMGGTYDAAYGGSSIPHYLEIPIAGIGGEYTLKMPQVARNIPERFGPDKTVMEVTYEGHEVGIVDYGIDVGTRTAKIYRSLDDTPHAIGAVPDGSEPPDGATRFEPFTEVFVKQCLNPYSIGEDPATFSAGIYSLGIGGLYQMIEALTTKCNEGGWNFALLDQYCYEGQYLYMGAEWEVHRDFRVTLTHHFIEEPSTAIPPKPIYKYIWNRWGAEADDEPVDGATTSKRAVATFGTDQESRIYETANASGVTQPYNFSWFQF